LAAFTSKRSKQRVNYSLHFLSPCVMSRAELRPARCTCDSKEVRKLQDKGWRNLLFGCVVCRVLCLFSEFRRRETAEVFEFATEVTAVDVAQRRSNLFNG